MASLEFREALEVDGSPCGFQIASFDTDFSYTTHDIDNAEGEWRVTLVEPSDGNGLTTQEARAHLAECAAIIDTAERLNAGEVCS